MSVSKCVKLAKYQDLGNPQPDAVSIAEEPAPTESTLGFDDIIVKAAVFSVDPFQRIQYMADGGKQLGDVLTGYIGGTVTHSKNQKWPVGSRICALLPYKDTQLVTADQLSKTVSWTLDENFDISLGVGVLGMPGATAYGGLIDILRPNKGETLWVSGAAGAVGSLVGQLAKSLYGCKVIGSAGGPEKCDLVESKFGFDKCIDYKTVSTASELEAKVREFSPEGVDMYYDNVGGIHFDAAFKLLKRHGRIAVCGGISMYGVPEEEMMRSFNPLDMIYSFQRIEGFICRPWLTGEKGNFRADMQKWLVEGVVKSEETEFHGIEKFGSANSSLYVGGNVGKAVLRL